MGFLYNLLLYLGTPLWIGYTLWRIGRGSWRERWWERFGFVPPGGNRNRLWLHAVSVGEVLAALPVLKALRQRCPEYEIVVSTTTPTGQRSALELAHCYTDQIFYCPLDLPFAVKRAVKRIRPRALLLMETELWLNLLKAVKGRGGTVVILNGRLSDSSFARARKGKKFYRYLLRFVDFACVQSPTDAARFVELGLPPFRLAVVGNTKFDQALEVADADPVEWRKRLHLPPDSPVIVVGSTRTAEEELLVVEAYQQILKQVTTACLVLAPRHLERVAEIERLMRARGLDPKRRTALAEKGGEPAQVVIVDTFGELARLYSVATVAVVGGGFAPLGGQNLLQPLAHGKPVFFGPHMHNFRDIAALAKFEGVGFEVESAQGLAEAVLHLLANPTRLNEIGEKARTLVRQHQGASERCVEQLLRLIGNPLPLIQNKSFFST